MRKELYFFITLILLQSNFLLSQEIEELSKEIPREKMFVHYNSSLVLAGESLRYKLYAINESSNELSNISKLGYLEILGEDCNVLFQQKIELENGSGYGDFFIPVDVKSGNYKILAYTQWMKNEGEESFFKGDLAIINPYTQDQSAIIDSTVKNDSSAQSYRNSQRSPETANKNAVVAISTSAKEYGKREKVLVNIELKGTDVESGSYSILVRKLDTFNKPQHPGAYMWSLKRQMDNSGKKSSGVIHLPEMRGEILSGKILNEQKTGRAIENQIVTLSIPGKHDLLKFAKTDEAGEFHFVLNSSDLDGERAVLQVMNSDAETYEIGLKEKFTGDYQKIYVSDFRFEPGMREWLKERSVYNQIENSYLDVKSDEVRFSSESSPFYGQMTEVYDLDDYNRFPTVKETFVEIIKFGSIRKGTDGKRHFEVRSFKSSLSSGLPTLLLVDGLLVQNHEEFMDFDSRKIDRIGVLRDKYFLGPLVFQGIITIDTKQHNYSSPVLQDGILVTEPLRFSPEKIYFSPDYEDSQQEHIPDFRYELYWNPDIKLKKENQPIKFYTSDVSGTYQITLEGFTGEGRPVSAKTTIVVPEDM